MSKLEIKTSSPVILKIIETIVAAKIKAVLNAPACNVTINEFSISTASAGDAWTKITLNGSVTLPTSTVVKAVSDTGLFGLQSDAK